MLYNDGMKKVILASQSKVRQSLMRSIGIDFESIPAHIDEKSIRDTDLVVRAQKIANAKAEKILQTHPHEVVIACDTFSECEGKVLEKPQNEQEAQDMLSILSGKQACNYTAMRYIDQGCGIDVQRVVEVKYTFRTLYSGEINEYVKNFPVTQWAAAFALVHPYVTTFIASIEGSYTGLSYGLPAEIIIPLLKKSGFEPKPQK